MFIDMPREVVYNSISYLNCSDRLNFRLTNSEMYSAVTRRDLHVDNIVIEKDADKLMVKYGDDLILNVNLKNDEEVEKFLDVKAMLFRRAFASRLILSLDSFDDNTLNIVKSLLERCKVNSLDYCAFSGEIDERLCLFLSNLETTHITLFTDEPSIDPNLLLTISRPIDIYYLHSSGIEYWDDKVLFELHSSGKSVVDITTPNALQRIAKTISSLDHQCASYYEGTRIDIFKTFLKDFPESPWTFHMTNLEVSL